jgi:hypothetical protein
MVLVLIDYDYVVDPIARVFTFVLEPRWQFWR